MIGLEISNVFWDGPCIWCGVHTPKHADDCVSPAAESIRRGPVVQMVRAITATGASVVMLNPDTLLGQYGILAMLNHFNDLEPSPNEADRRALYDSISKKDVDRVLVVSDGKQARIVAIWGTPALEWEHREGGWIEHELDAPSMGVWVYEGRVEHTRDYYGESDVSFGGTFRRATQEDFEWFGTDPSEVTAIAEENEMAIPFLGAPEHHNV